MPKRFHAHSEKGKEGWADFASIPIDCRLTKLTPLGYVYELPTAAHNSASTHTSRCIYYKVNMKFQLSPVTLISSEPGIAVDSFFVTFSRNSA